jgi:hypothetical protein
LARLDEDFARESFARFLHRIDFARVATWTAGSEPPDFDLTVGRENYAVEVTMLVRQVTTDGLPQSKRKVVADLLRFAQETKQYAISQGILHGGYVLELEPVADLKRVAAAPRSAIFAYLTRTKDLSKAEEETVLESPRACWTIQKHHDQGTYLHATICEHEGGLVSELLGDFPGLLRSAIARKVSKLSHVTEPAILLLVDDYQFAGASFWQEQLPADLCQGFHTIARVFNEYECQVLWSKNLSWWTSDQPGQSTAASRTSLP